LFIPLLIRNKLYSSIRIINYFITQSLASSIFLLVILCNKFLILEIINEFLIIRIFIKLGFCPFHSWIIQCSEGLSWIRIFILRRLQKIIPLYILSIHFNWNLFWWFCWGLSLVFSVRLILSTLSFRKMIIISSINHICWILLAIVNYSNIWVVYYGFYIIFIFCSIFLFNKFQAYSLSNLFLLKSKFLIFILFLRFINFIGVPPSLGFFPKMIVILDQNFNKLFLIILLLRRLINSYTYIRVIFISINIFWFLTPLKSKFNIQIIVIINLIIFLMVCIVLL